MEDRTLHPDAIDFVALVRDQLSRGDARRVRLHCAVCDDCAVQLEAVVILRRGASPGCVADLAGLASMRAMAGGVVQ